MQCVPSFSVFVPAVGVDAGLDLEHGQFKSRVRIRSSCVSCPVASAAMYCNTLRA